MIENPYVNHVCVSGDLFLLRERSELVDRIIETVHQGKDVIISGRPHAGKSSVMSEIRRREQKYHVVLTWADSYFGDIEKLKKRVHKNLEEYLQRTSRVLELPSPEDNFAAYICGLDQRLATAGETLLLQFDEVTRYLAGSGSSKDIDNVGQVSERFKRFHDAAQQTPNIRWMLQIHKPTDIYDILARDAAPLFDHYVEYEIPFFTRQQTHEVLRRLGKEYLDFTEEALDFIHNTYDGNPMRSVKAGAYIFNHFYLHNKPREHKPIVTAAFVENLLGQIGEL